MSHIHHRSPNAPAADETGARDLQNARMDDTARVRMTAEAELDAAFQGKAKFTVGSSGGAVAILKDALGRLGLRTNPLSSDMFTPEEMSQVRDYQERCGLRADGIIGRETLRAINSELIFAGQPPLPGGFDPSAFGTVRMAQRALNMVYENSRSLKPLAEDGVFGAKTRERVLHYQRTSNLKETGAIDEATRNSLLMDIGYGGHRTAMPVQVEQKVESPQPAPEPAVVESQSLTVPKGHIPKISTLHANQLAELFANNGTLPEREQQFVVNLLSSTPHLESVRSEFRTITNRDLLSAIRQQLDGKWRLAAIAQYGKAFGWVSAEDSAQIMDNVSKIRS